MFRHKHQYFLLIIKVILFSACPNEEMRDLVELKVSDPLADSFLIESGDVSTASRTVILSSDVKKEKDSLEMRFKNSGYSWSQWEIYSNTKIWTLPIGDGFKTIYAEYRDEGHNVVGMSDIIELDTQHLMLIFLFGEAV